jgi:hypothetical protein
MWQAVSLFGELQVIRPTAVAQQADPGEAPASRGPT